MPRYRFVRADNKIICLSSYGKKVVRGIAKCSPNDSFDLAIGEKLAQLRCDEKVEAKRLNRATEKYFKAIVQLNEARDYFFAMEQYYNNSKVRYDDICEKLNRFEKTI